MFGSTPDVKFLTSHLTHSFIIFTEAKSLKFDLVVTFSQSPAGYNCLKEGENLYSALQYNLIYFLCI